MKCVLCNSENFKIITKKIRDNIECNVVQCLSCNLVSLENHTKNIIDYDKNYRKTHSPILGKQLSPSEFFDYELPFQEPHKLITIPVAVSARAIKVARLSSAG